MRKICRRQALHGSVTLLGLGLITGCAGATALPTSAAEVTPPAMPPIDTATPVTQETATFAFG